MRRHAAAVAIADLALSIGAAPAGALPSFDRVRPDGGTGPP